jgi:hypothetical protein
LEALTRKRSDVRLRRIDIESWGSPVAKLYGVRSLPLLWLYRDGEVVARGTRDVVDELNALR